MIIFLIHIIPRSGYFVWFEKEAIKDIFLSGEDYYESGLRSIYGTTPHAKEYYKSKQRLFKISVISLLLFFISLLLVFFIHVGSILLAILCLVFSLNIIVLVWSYWGKEYPKKNPSGEVEEFFNNWIEVRVK